MKLINKNIQTSDPKMSTIKEKIDYATCPKGHKIFVIWSDHFQCFAFTCGECNQYSMRAVSLHGVIEVKIVQGTSR